MNALATYWIGRRVEISPHHDAWMMGDRYGKVIQARHELQMDRDVLTIRTDIRGRQVRDFAEDVTLLD